MRGGWIEHGGTQRWRLGALAALLAFACLLAVVPRADAATGMEVAVQDDPLFVGSDYCGRPKGLEQAGQLGATRIRVNVSWAFVLGRQATARKAPRKPKYDWSLYDGLVQATQGTNVRVQFALVGPAPAWATGDRKVGPYKPSAKRFGQFARAAAAHFGTNVDRWSIWNEPNYVGWLAPLRGGGRHYRSMYVAGYDAIKAVNPAAQVLIAETSPYKIVKGRKREQFATAPLVFLREMTCANADFTRTSCGGLVTDGYAHHPYDFDHPPTYKDPGPDNVTLSTLDRLTSALDRLATAGGLRTPSGGAPDLYLTEYGYFRSGKRRVAEAKRAKYMVQAFTMAQRHPRVRQMLQYLIAQPAQKYRFFDTSIVSSGGRPSKTFKALQKWAKGALARSEIAAAPVTSGVSGGGGPSTGGGGGSGGSGGTTPPGDAGATGPPCLTTTPVPVPAGCTPALR